MRSKHLRDPLTRRLRPLVYTLVAVVAFILFLTWTALRAQVALAGFLNGESVWSKAQKQVSVDLLHYVATGDPADYADLQRNFVTLDAFRSVRDQVISGHFTYAKAEAELTRGHAMVIAIPSVIFMFRHMSNAPYMRQAISIWRSTDGAVAELGAIGRKLHQDYAAGGVSPAVVAAQRDRILALNDFIGPRAASFSLTIANGAVATARGLFAAIVVLAVAAIALWLLTARRVLKGIHEGEERYRLLFDNAPDAIVMVDEDNGQILAANRTTGAWAERDPESLVGQDYGRVSAQYALCEAGSAAAESSADDPHTRLVETQSSRVAWGKRVVRQSIMRDVTERVHGERARRIAAEALASIAEGVLIADSERRVVSVNSAALQITGATEADLVGRRFDDTRALPDGEPLPESIWTAVASNGHWSGEVKNRRQSGGSYPERLGISTVRDANHRVAYYVAVFSDISEAKADRYRLEHVAAHDALTGLVNRVEFQRCCGRAIERAARERTAVAVLFVDLDAFKIVNDSYSHAVGDSLLQQVGERVRGQLRQGQVAGRIGGDEFTVLVPGLALREDAATLADRLLSVLSEPFQVEDYEIVVSASIGIAGYPLDGEDAQTLIANADAAMYVAKTEERNTRRFYVPMMQADARQRLLLATELRQALQNGEFKLTFQPSVELASGRIVGAEALLRWQHPQRGEVMPSDFIPVAESTGMIHRIDEWVMHAVCRQIHAWDAVDMPQLRIALNVSARWFGHPGFVDSVQHALQESAVDPKRVVLEITEGAMLRLGDETERTMQALGVLGVGVAIDDFGTGYASMAYLKLPSVAYLKIDQSFVRGLPNNTNDAAIIHAMVAMAQSLGLTTIAEGVEEEAQHDFLAHAGCVEGQGFLYAYPLPPTALERMLRPKRNPADVKLKLVPPCRS
ncbi:MAG TPA: EAL domain-containing protein [Rhodanobacteraceae bacterium]